MSSSTYKVVLLGEGRVGKTSLISRFVKEKFDAEEASTVQANMYNKKKVTVDGRTIDLSIWDTAGQERFHALGPIYYRNSNGAVLVYDITDADTFEKVKMWIKELKAVVGDSISIVICGNKADMERDRDIDEAIAQTYATKEAAQHFNTSAKLNLNVSEAFEALARAIIAQESVAGAGGASGHSMTKRKKKGGLQIEQTSDAQQQPASASTSTTGHVTSSERTTSSAAADDPYSSYDSYDKSPSTGGGGSTKPRKNTIILSSTPSEPEEHQASGGSAAGSQKKPQPKKSSGKCCS
jgi:small GTP-binding protein